MSVRAGVPKLSQNSPDRRMRSTNAPSPCPSPTQGRGDYKEPPNISLSLLGQGWGEGNEDGCQPQSWHDVNACATRESSFLPALIQLEASVPFLNQPAETPDRSPGQALAATN
jgi:hypothetical protein